MYDFDLLFDRENEMRADDPHGRVTNNQIEWLAKQEQLKLLADEVEDKKVSFILSEILEQI